MEIFDIAQLVVKIVLVVTLSLSSVPILVWFERRGSAWMQRRVGPNRVGPFGLFQPIADALKFFKKETFVPRDANKGLYLMAPMIALIAPICALSVIPFGSHIIVMGEKVLLQISNMDTGVIFILAFASLEVYPIILAGWSSNNKYTVLGALRASSQIVSYEISMGLALLSILIVYGTFDPHEMVKWQSEHVWGALVNPFGALVFWISIFAETNRLPFDLPEGESEIVAGFHLEYGGMKFAAFFMAEYVAMIMASGLLATLFFGGYGLLPGFESLVQVVVNLWGATEVGAQNIKAVFEFLSFVLKLGFFLFVFVWIRWSLPRFRFDQLMDLGWKILFPLSLINLFVVTLAVYCFNS